MFDALLYVFDFFLLLRLVLNYEFFGVGERVALPRRAVARDWVCNRHVDEDTIPCEPGVALRKPSTSWMKQSAMSCEPESVGSKPLYLVVLRMPPSSHVAMSAKRTASCVGMRPPA